MAVAEPDSGSGGCGAIVPADGFGAGGDSASVGDAAAGDYAVLCLAD